MYLHINIYVTIREKKTFKSKYLLHNVHVHNVPLYICM